MWQKAMKSSQFPERSRTGLEGLGDISHFPKVPNEDFPINDLTGFKGTTALVTQRWRQALHSGPRAGINYLYPQLWWSNLHEHGNIPSQGLWALYSGTWCFFYLQPLPSFTISDAIRTFSSQSPYTLISPHLLECLRHCNIFNLFPLLFP